MMTSTLALLAERRHQGPVVPLVVGGSPMPTPDPKPKPNPGASPAPMSADIPDWDAMAVVPSSPTTGIVVDTLPNGTETAFTEDGTVPRWRVAASDHANAAITALVGNSYTRFREVMEAVNTVQAAQGGLDVAITLPSDRDIEVTAASAVVGAHAALGTLAVIGAINGSNQPRVSFAPAAGSKGFTLNAPTDEAHAQGSHLHLRNIRLGPLPSVESAHLNTGGWLATTYRNFDDLARYSFGGDMLIVNCVLAGCNSGDGVKAIAKDLLAEEYGRVLVYDTELRNNGQDGLRHNFYVASVAEFRVVRCISYMATLGHALKINSPKAYVLDSQFANFDTRLAAPQYGSQTPVNATKTSRVWMHRCVMEVASSSTKVSQTYNEAARESDGGGRTLWVPWPWEHVTFNPSAGDAQYRWQINGDGQHSQMYGGNVGEWDGTDVVTNQGRVSYEHPPHAPIIWLQTSGVMGQTVPATSWPELDTLYDLRICATDPADESAKFWSGQAYLRRALRNTMRYDAGDGSLAAGNVVTGATSGATGTVESVTGTTSGTITFVPGSVTPGFVNDEDLQVAGVTRARVVNGQNAGDRYWDIQGPPPSFGIRYKAKSTSIGVRPASLWIAKLPTDVYDCPIFNSAYFNRHDPNYYWSKIDDGSGLPDHENAQDWLSPRWFTDCLVMGDYTARFGAYFSCESATNYMYLGRVGASLPRPPMNYPVAQGQSAPAHWPDIAGAAEFAYLENQGQTDARFPFGANGSLDDYVQPFFWAFRDTSVRGWRGAQNGGTARVQFQQRPNQSHTDEKHAPLFVLDGSGVAQRTVTDEADPFVIAATPEVSGAHAAGTRVLNVTDSIGMAAGQKVHLRYMPQRGRRQLHVTSVVSVDGPGRITLADTTDHDLVGGEEIATFAAAGTKPGWWNDGVS